MNRKFCLYALAGLALCAVWWRMLPEPLFRVPCSTVLEDRNGDVLGMTVASDGQYRFSGGTGLPDKYVTALMLFEDGRFLWHGGADWPALCRAMYQNVRAGRVVSGGSTLSMQVIRMSRGNRPRTYWEKVKEVMLAIRLEQGYPKYRILQLYAANAPFGGNIVGMQAAAKKYFDRRPEQLSWAEAALLAVLPNAPSLRNGERLKGKRDQLLERLYRAGVIGEDEYRLGRAEPVPGQVYAQACAVPHLLAKTGLAYPGEMKRCYVDVHLQKRVNEIIARHSRMQAGNLIYNAAVLVAHIPTGEVRAYAGNSPALPGSRGNDVDVITSVRSSGSILKPALYALMQQNGYLLPGTLVADVPSRFGSYVPSNFNRSFLGAVPADEALAMSLNIPFVRMLKSYSYVRFYEDLKELGITSLNREADDYGLSLILGGAETSLWDLCNMYGGMVSVLRHYREEDGLYYAGEYSRLKLWEKEGEKGPEIPAAEAPLKASAVWLTLEAMRRVERPELESGWKNFVSRMDLAWKTGTSFGFRDAWAVGVNADWVVGVWVGNADGEGRPGLVGVRAAAPLLFEVAGLLPVEGRLEEPSDEMREMAVCRRSGYRASELCEEKDTVRVCGAGVQTELCPYHRLVNLDRTGAYRVTSDCENVYNMQVRPWFVLPPVQEWYYVRTHSDYRKLPPFRPGCVSPERDVMEMIYPQRGTRVFIPRDFGGEQGSVVFELAHRQPATEVYWHVDDVYLGLTKDIHQMEICAGEGLHVLTLVDAAGNTLRQSFRVVGQ